MLSLLLYNSETWALKEESKRRLLVFEMGCLKKDSGSVKKGQDAEHRYQEEGRCGRGHCAKNHKKENEVLWPPSPHASITVP